MIALFDRYPLVLIGEDHWLRAAGDFYNSLVSDPEFPKHANTLVLECGNSLYQPILDRYENGEDVPFEQIAQVWRNTTKVMGWESPIYANLIAAVRNANMKLPAAQRIRVLAADSPIDWSQVHESRDYERAFGGNKFFASIIEREVLDKNRKALVIMGDNHLLRGGDSWGNDDVTDMIDKHHRHAGYVILFASTVKVFDVNLSGSDPLFYPIQKTRTGAQFFSGGRRLEDAADAILYLPPRGRSWPDWNALENDPRYAELQRRHLIEYGCPLNLDTWKHLTRHCQ